MPTEPIDLDHNATTRPSPGVIEAVTRGLTELWVNPSSVHRGGQNARAAMELARQQLANLINAKPRELVLTSSCTEAIDLGVRGVLDARGGGGKRVLSIAAQEADIVGINPSMKAGVVGPEAAADATAEATDRKVGWVREVAGDRAPAAPPVVAPQQVWAEVARLVTVEGHEDRFPLADGRRTLPRL